MSVRPQLGDGPTQVRPRTEKVLPVSMALRTLGAGLVPPSGPVGHREATRAVEASQWEGKA